MPNFAGFGMLYLRPVASKLELWVVVHHVIDGVDGPRKDFVGLTLLQHLYHGPLEDPGQPNSGLKLLPEIHVQLTHWRREGRVFQKLRHTQHGDSPRPECASALYVYVAVRAGVEPRRIAHPGPSQSHGALTSVLVGEEGRHTGVIGGQLSLHYRHVHLLPGHACVLLAVPGEEGGHGRNVAGLELDVVASQLQRVSIRETRGVHPATHCKECDFRRQVVPVGAVLPVVGDGGHYEIGIDALNGLVVQTQPVHHARPEVLHKDVGSRYQLLQRCQALRRFEVQYNVSLVGVQRQKHPALIGMRNIVGERTKGAGVVAGSGSFHLNHICAVVGQHLGAVRPGHTVSKIYDTKVR